MSRISNEELARELAKNIDADGNDLALARAVAAMTPEERAQSDANLRASIAGVRATLRPRKRRAPGAV